jgi:endonuclease YncB( thermonuclease family)
VARLVRALLALVLVAASPNAVWNARVVTVTDGDSISVAVDGKDALKVRLFGIDTPEHDQPYAREARQALVRLVSGRGVRLETHGSDRFGRLLARVFRDELDVNAELVRLGAAWVYRKYSDDEALLALEREARAEKRGLWALPASERVPPWEWRHPDAPTEPATQPARGADYVCGAKTYCREMTSCAEARFYLKQCGLTRLDGDGDGVPCSSLCKQ